MKAKFLAFLCATTLAASACGAGKASDGADERLRDAERRVAELEARAASGTESTAPLTRASSTTAAPTTAPLTTAAPTTAPPTTTAPQAVMPDVVCMNLQEAQDYIQAETGVFLSLSEDATGAGRNQVIDSNWIVVDQRPAPGTPFGEGDAVLSAVKLEESNPC